MIRRQIKNSLLRTFFRMFVLFSFVLSSIHGQEEGRLDSIKAVNDELLRIEQDLIELRREETRKPAVGKPVLASPPAGVVIPQLASPAGRLDSIKAVNDELLRIEQDLIEMQREETRKPVVEKPVLVDPPADRVVPQLPPATGRLDSIRKVDDNLRRIEQDLLVLQGEEPRRPAVGKPVLASQPVDKVIPQFMPAKDQVNSIRKVNDTLLRIEQDLLALQKEETEIPAVVEPIPAKPLLAKKMLLLPPRKSYFLFVNPGIVFAGERDYAQSTGSNDFLLRTRPGFEFSVAFGVQLGNWTMGPEVGRRRIGYKQFIIPGLPPYQTTGDSTSSTLALYVGRDFPLQNSWNLNAGVSLGVANSDETFTIQGVPGIPPFTADGSHFQGSMRLALEYSFSELCAAHFGYRFTHVDDLREFDSMPTHQAELGLRWNL